MQKKILMVCLGNICRSPVAEGIMRSKIEKLNLNIMVDSAGTSSYHIGENPDKRSTRNAAKNGVDISKLKARQFSIKDFDEFDIIYTMDSSNYGDVISIARNKEDANKVKLILDELYPNSGMNVPDPYFGGEQGFENVFLLLNNACEVIAQKLLIETENVG